MKEKPCQGASEQGTGSSTVSTSASAPSATTAPASGGGSKTSVVKKAARAAARANAKTARTSAIVAQSEPAPFEMDGWRCESFERKTGHSVGRSVQRGDLQLCLTVGTREPEELRQSQHDAQALPERVLAWLMTGTEQRKTLASSGAAKDTA
jgi:hypothetical protein